MDETKSKDTELWQTWRKSRSPADLDALLKQFAPLMRREVGRWAANAPLFLLENEAKRLAIKAFEDYDPKRVPHVALGSHLVNRWMPLSRVGYSRQSVVSVPEQQRLAFNTYHRVKSELEDLTGRPPKLHEIADHMRLPPKKLQSIIDTVGKKEFMESGDGPAFVQHVEDPETINLAFHDMTPVQKDIFRMRTGYENHPVLDGKAIMKKTGLTQGMLSYQLNQIKALLERAQGLR